jgi:hypothetical protein
MATINLNMWMRYQFLIFFLTVAVSVFGQGNTLSERGWISYITTQNVYVKFESTEKIDIGDTLYLTSQGKMIPALIVDNKSSISCVCSPIPTTRINISDEIFAQKSKSENTEGENPPGLQEVDSVSAERQSRPRYRPNSLAENNERSSGVEESGSQTNIEKEKLKDAKHQDISGRVSITSYNTLSESDANHRMRYTLALRGDHLANTRLSMDSYITFRHTLNEWDEVKNNLNSALKVYTLALSYDFSSSSSLTAGRKINPKISSMGAIDGVQFEQGVGNFLFGALIGSRPDYEDYSLNLNLFQYGAYLSHEISDNNQFLQSTLGYIEQRNNNKIDRRFIYFQNNSSLFKNLNLFTSAEMSLYENISDQPRNVFDLTNLYASARYRFSRKLSVSVSYDNRKNIQYYETFKSFIDKLIDEETRQGIRLNANYRLFRHVIWGVNAGWRFQKSQRDLSKNLNSYLTFSRIPSLNLQTTLTANFLQTNYLNSKIFGIRVSREIIPKKLDGNINIRMVDYRYLNYESVTRQNIAGINLSWDIIKKLTFYVDYEGTFDHQDLLYHRIYTKIIQRF